MTRLDLFWLPQFQIYFANLRHCFWPKCHIAQKPPADYGSKMTTRWLGGHRHHRSVSCLLALNSYQAPLRGRHNRASARFESPVLMQAILRDITYCSSDDSHTPIRAASPQRHGMTQWEGQGRDRRPWPHADEPANDAPAITDNYPPVVHKQGAVRRPNTQAIDTLGRSRA